MPVTVKLNDIVEALDFAMDQPTHYLDKRTGEIVLFSSEEEQAAENDNPISEYPEWQRELILKAREVSREPEHFIPLPAQFEINEYQMMEVFCLSLANRRIGEELLRQIRGKGAFRRFKDAIDDLGVDETWYEFKQQQLEQIAIEWLEENEIVYSRDDATETFEASM